MRVHGIAFVMMSIAAMAASPKTPVYEIDGRVDSEAPLSVSIYGATTPFTGKIISDVHGRFRFRKLLAGSYTVSMVAPGRGEARITVDVGPRTADPSGRVALTLNLNDSDYAFSDVVQRDAVSARQLAVPDKAWKEYEEARKELGRRDSEAARRHLERAVEMAPQFAIAWNNLGTIAYQTKNYMRAEQCFREALAQDPAAYDALVNLGGVLINLNRLDEARQANERAISRRPNDALANSQLGLTYFELGQVEPAEKFLRRAVEIDPAHFSHPQLVLARIHASQNKPTEAAAGLEDFLRRHPDSPDAESLRKTIVKLRAPLGPR